GRIGKVGRTAAFLLFPFCGRIDEQFARPQLYLFSIAAVLARKVARPHFAFFPFAAVQMSNSRRETAPGWHTS
ncbi:MAG: hypothetical protein IKH41_10590, partial [Clostridia bacterium]|nr:hypothetical protein [Clostridia bacterium]